MRLSEGSEGISYEIGNVDIKDEELKSFLFTLGCYEGETITVVTKKKHNMVVAIKDGRYNIDNDMAAHIKVA